MWLFLREHFHVNVLLCSQLPLGHQAGMGVGLLLLLVLVAALLLVGYRFHARQAQPFKFSYFRVGFHHCLFLFRFLRFVWEFYQPSGFE